MTDDLQKFLDELRARISISDLIGEKTKLTKRGREYIGLCPFHQEKTPSFTINESKGFYHCFGCGAHGDIVKFLMDSEGLPFIEAVRKLASRCGLELPNFSKESQEANARRKSLYEIMEMAVAFYEKNLAMPVGAEGLKYFQKKRELSSDIVKKFRLGYASSNNALKAYLLSKGIAEQDLAELGLLAVPEDQNRSSYDFFRDRVMIPIFDKQNNAIAFGGRIMDNSQPKYLNSPETPIFNKRRILYNMNNAREPAYACKRLIICEGYMDVIALDAFGFSYAVAPLGTALTEEQILEAWKVCNTPVLCFDGDSAGIKAAIRSIDRVLPILRPGYSVNYIFLKECKDPDELLHKFGAEKFEQYLQKAKPLVDILWHKCKMNKELQTPEQKALMEKETLEEVSKIKDSQIRTYYVREMKARIFELFKTKKENKNNIVNTKENNIKIKSEYKQKTDGNFVKKPPLSDLVLRSMVAGMIVYPELISRYEEKIASFEIKDSIMTKILSEIIEINQSGDSLDSDILLEKLKLNYEQDIGGLWEINMYKMQKITLLDLKHELDNCLCEIQLKQIDADIKFCVKAMNEKPDNADELYERYQRLLEEKNSLLVQND